MTMLTPLQQTIQSATLNNFSPAIQVRLNLCLLLILILLPSVTPQTVKNYKYWAYVPFPPLIRAMTWMDAPIEVYVSDSIWTPGSVDDRCPAQPSEEGTPFNITLGFRYPPLCLGPTNGCLSLDIQTWAVTLPSGHSVPPLGHLVSGLSLKPLRQIKTRITDYIHISQYKPLGPACPLNLSSHADKLIWKDCISSEGMVLFNSSHYATVDWAPKGHITNDCSQGHRDCQHFVYDITYQKNSDSPPLLYHRLNSFFPFKWKGAGVAPPKPRLIVPHLGTEHSELWRLTIAMTGMRVWAGESVISKSTLSPRKLRQQIDLHYYFHTAKNITMAIIKRSIQRWDSKDYEDLYPPIANVPPPPLVQPIPPTPHSQKTVPSQNIYTIYMESNKTIPLKSCVKPLYMLLVEKMHISSKTNIITCVNCYLHTCIDSSFKQYHSILIVTAREGIWLPVTLHRPWES
uniref:Envelope polyprotein n=1 Tax=Papio anubis TaxID=9555 RepID=A0A8I5NM76_PAPAN